MARKKGKRKGTYHGFKSKKQWRWAFASKQPWAHEKAHRTAGGPKVRYRRLPADKHSGRKGSRTPVTSGHRRKVFGRKTRSK